MTYQEAMEYLSRQQSRGMVLGLDTMRRLLAQLGNPQDQLRFIQVAGTNGKGSVCAFLESVLVQAGYRTGRYLSPAVFDFCEQIQIDGQWVPQAAVARQMERIRHAVEKMDEAKEPLPTVYEMTTAMAFLCFVDYACDYVVLETGLGGDLDATNVVTTTVCSVLTSISLDHTRILGETLPEIASHKAGSIKPGVPVVVCRNACAEVNRVIAQQADKQNSPVVFVDPADAEEKKKVPGGRIIRYGSRDYRIGLLGSFQVINSAVACQTVEVLRGQGLKIKETAFQNGMARAKWHGRMELLCEQPPVLADGAHNPDAAKQLRLSLEKDFTNVSFVCIIGILRDKDYRQVLQTMLPLARRVYAVCPDSPRALPAQELAQTVTELAEQMKLPVTVEIPESLEEAWKRARRDAETAPESEKTGVLAFGSLYYIGDLIRLVRSDETMQQEEQIGKSDGSGKN